ncbi:class I SAM-dependent RNA methyltransferase [Microbacterium sp. M28]|uniref:class I SAM-dependent RNA methyltransferase n=1 Tax=Microbacterium sp. M28 TaxID=2962064 RepID=UPI0021F4D4BC|nr:TRAM domain-containing protein [Microbacterium sp. M28]UYO96087.1 class I SAM-dependent RNA methyltransferase [Microbacterium sp. M28]
MTSSAELLDLDITGIAHGGTFVARHEGRVVFVSDAVPGERVRARLSETPSDAAMDTRRFWRAETVEVLEASPHRRPHIWPEADVTREPSARPGGADLGHIDLGHQRVLKRQVLAEALDRFAGGGLDAPEIAALDDSDGTGWRTRVTLHVDADGVVGPFGARSHRVVPVSSHPLARPAVAAAAAKIGVGRPGSIELVEPADGDVRVLALPEKGRRAEPEEIVERVRERSFTVDASGFWQVHHGAAEALDAAVSELLAGRVDPDLTHLDLYGGVGLFSASLADLGGTDIITVESDRRATEHAARNLAPLDVTAVTARVDRFLGAPVRESRPVRGRRRSPRPAAQAVLDTSTPIGAVVLDPPRSGAGRGVVDAVAALSPEAIVYVACDPVALARDLGTFRAHGWEPTELRGFDLFPHTHHFEVVALLTR